MCKRFPEWVRPETLVCGFLPIAFEIPVLIASWFSQRRLEADVPADGGHLTLEEVTHGYTMMLCVLATYVRIRRIESMSLLRRWALALRLAATGPSGPSRGSGGPFLGHGT